MPLAIGARLGPYEVVSALGAGGMGEVYKARDTRLDRTVAIKVLPNDVAGDPDLRARFEREARAVAALDHPHICGIYDVGSVDGTHYLVMPHLEGQTLAARLEKGPLPLDHALKIATEIADALDKAHRQGIIHRDLKPANIMLTKSGAARQSSPQAKLLDFGLAKLRAKDGPISMSGLTQLATRAPETAHGTILGTVQYMAPEQLEGREADARSDIWALGAVIYEMVTGTRPFQGDSPASVIGAILKDTPPPISTRQPLSPTMLDRAVARCFEKDPDARWQSAADLQRVLEWAGDSVLARDAHARQSFPAAGTPVAHSRRLVGILAFVAALAAGALTWQYMSTPSPPPASVRFEIVPPPDVLLSPAPVASAAQLALSPDGRRIVFVAAPKYGVSQLWLRPLNGVQVQLLAGTEGASFPFWSPDSRSLAFFAGGKLKKIDTMGGAPEVLCDAPGGRGGAWSPDGTIVFTSAPNSPISQIAAIGGAVRPATTFHRDQGASAHNWPQFLPDGRHYLFYQSSFNPEHQGIYVGSLDSAESTRVVGSTSAGLYSSGYLLIARNGALFAQAFDDRTFQTRGEAVRIADRVGYFSSALGYAAVTASQTGVLAYGPSVAMTTSLQWRDRDGAATGSAIAPAVYRSPRLSPDQKRVLVTRWEPESANNDIFVLELALRNLSRMTFDPLNDWFPAWSSDGSRIFFGSTRAGATRIFRKAGSGPDEFFAGGEDNDNRALYPNDTSSDGRFLTYTQVSPDGYDLSIASLSGDAKKDSFLASPANEVQGRFAPNGRWLAYASDESGKFEVYVRPFPVGSGQDLISVAGGMQPEWRRDGKELFYISADRKLMAVPVTTDGTKFFAGTPHALFDVQMPEQTPPYPTDYAVATDGQRFLVNTVVDQPTRPALTVIVNWTAELEK